MTKQSGFILLLCVFALGESSGVTKWCTYSDTLLSTYSSATYRYNSLETAKAQCLLRSDCFGITREGGSSYTLRKNSELETSSSGEVTYVPCDGYFRCETFGLKSAHDMFLSAQSDGGARADGPKYGSWEQITFEQSGEANGFLKSYVGKYLSSEPSGNLRWDVEDKKSWEMFKIYQYEDKIALQSHHGTYISGEPDGSVNTGVTWKRDWEWFTVYPQNCLNNIQCDCSKAMNRDEYELSGVEYHAGKGTVHAIPPEQVGYQHVDNRDSTAQQSTTFTVSESVTETSSFTHTAGASVTVGTEFSTGVPFLAEGKISVDLTASYSYSSGSTKSKTNTLKADYNCVANPGKFVSCTALLFKYQISVPYTQTWQHKRIPCTCTSDGTFSDISANEMRMVIKEE